MPMSLGHLITLNETERTDCVRKAVIIYNDAIKSVNSLYEIYRRSQEDGDNLNNNGQDLLRAMLVFACSGLDAVLKQLIHDGLQAIIEIDPGAHKEFEKFAERRLRKLSRANASDEVVGIDSSFLSTLFTSNSPRQVLLVELRNNLLKDSLQSVDQIAKVASNFAITKQQVISSDEETKKAFEIRNQIIHEMDSDLASEDNRRQRTADEIKPLCENVLAVAERFVQLVLSRTRDYAA